MPTILNLFYNATALSDSLTEKINAVDGHDGRGDTRMSDGVLELLLAQNVSDISQCITNKKVSAEVFAIGKDILEGAFTGMMSSYDNSDGPGCGTGKVHTANWWPPRPHLYSTHVAALHSGPGGDPWRYDKPEMDITLHRAGKIMGKTIEKYGSNRQALLAELLRQNASLTINRKASAALLAAAKATMQSNTTSAAYAVFDDYCGSTGPRPPIVLVGNEILVN